jgi:hypothetical protein
MEQHVKNPSASKKSTTAKGETAAELVHRHLMDANHVTTDEELRNVQIEVHNEETSEAANAEDVKSSSDEEQSPLAKSDDVVVTPWDTLK